MTAALLPARLSGTARQLRLLVVLEAADRVGLIPIAARQLHTLAYLTDALAPVWNLPVLDGQILKQVQPYFPLLQADIDWLVGHGIVIASDVAYVEGDAGWELHAHYAPNREFAQPIVDVAEQLSLLGREVAFVREIVYAASGLGVEGIAVAADVDATYSDPIVDVGGLIELRPDRGTNASSQVAFRFSELLGKETELSAPEMVNLYVRQLYSRMQSA